MIHELLAMINAQNIDENAFKVRITAKRATGLRH